MGFRPVKKPQQPRDILQAFRPRARVLQLLGDELIGSARLAVFELVKNAYDADANVAVITMDFSNKDEPSITVEDDGQGMTIQILRDVWLVPGDDYRHRQRAELKRSPKHNRLPLGEKGLGRFLSIFTRTYSNRGAGIRPIGKVGNHQAVVVNITIGGGKYPNEWLEPGKRLKCYLKARSNRGAWGGGRIRRRRI
jgi:hypothetical protein